MKFLLLFLLSLSVFAHNPKYLEGDKVLVDKDVMGHNALFHKCETKGTLIEVMGHHHNQPVRYGVELGTCNFTFWFDEKDITKEGE